MKQDRYCIGVDFGTDSVRAIIADAANGEEMASAVYHYPRWRDGLYCDASNNQFRQHPQDYLDGLTYTIRRCLTMAGPEVRKRVVAISADSTGSTPVATDATGTPLALHPEFADDPDAMFVLWKDHTAIKEAAAINAHARKFEEDYLRYVGGIYSSEWFWSKLLHVLRRNSQVREAGYSWVEHCDWIPFLLTGGRRVAEMKRSVCTAGHKALWSDAWGGLPPEHFFATLDPLLAGFRDRLYHQTYTADRMAGFLCAHWAEQLGLDTRVVVGIGAMDAHVGAVGGQIESYYLSKVMGTSTCDMLVAPMDEVSGSLVKGICGQVPGSVIPGMMGMEAGQSAFGDVYAWFRDLLAWPVKHLAGEPAADDVTAKIIPELSARAAQLSWHENSELSMDWFNGRRTPDANARLKGSISGLGLGSDPVKLFYSLVESTCFGARAIVDRFTEQGIPVRGLIGLGGIPQKSPFIMQMMADVFDRPIKISRAEQSSAMGAAMFAATAAGLYERVEHAMEAMGQGFEKEYFPDRQKVPLYNKRYGNYLQVGKFMEQAGEFQPATNS